MKRKVLTLGMVHVGGQVLLGMKKRGFGEGRWNGFGGKVEPGETVEAAACREFKEEAGISVEELKEVGVIEFFWPGGLRNGAPMDTMMEVHLYKVRRYSGEILESEEMRPQWFSKDEIPFDQMWSDDKYWMHLFLADKMFRASFDFDAQDQIIRHEVLEING